VGLGDISPDSALIWLGEWRIVLGIGVGGDHPMSASVSSDRASIRKCGTMLAYIFANQGSGSFVGSLATLIVLLCYKDVMKNHDKTSRVDGGEAIGSSSFPLIFFFVSSWRIVVGLSLILGFGTLYQRLTLGESTCFLKSKNLPDDEGSTSNIEDN
jgi:PHS family inorganic phosphate transporter-like MFS transporter